MKASLALVLGDCRVNRRAVAKPRHLLRDEVAHHIALLAVRPFAQNREGGFRPLIQSYRGRHLVLLAHACIVAQQVFSIGNCIVFALQYKAYKLLTHALLKGCTHA